MAILYLTVVNQSTQSSSLSSHVLLAAFFVGLMPQEIVITPAHLVRDASIFKVFHYHVL
jgi:hypothetical protein